MRTVFDSVLALALIIPASALLGARAVLPDTQCAVSADQIAAVKLQTSYDVVKFQLGCEGARELEFDIDGLRSETYSWRGSAWPYSTFKGTFYNGVLHKTEAMTLRLDIGFDWPSGAAGIRRG